MKMRHALTVTILVAITTAIHFGMQPPNHAEAATRFMNAGTLPTVPRVPGETPAGQQASGMPDQEYGPSFAYIAWRLFLDAMAPRDGSPTFETWTEQCQLARNIAGCPSQEAIAAALKNSGNGRVRLLHGSIGRHTATSGGGECGAMKRTPIDGYPAPANLSNDARYCEEVFVSPTEADFVQRNLSTLLAQQSYGSVRNGAINFPGTEQNDPRLSLDSFEIKVDWVPRSSFTRATFACPDRSGRLYTEQINGQCYALAAVHITSKVMPNWLWATFEPDSSLTNPNRCDAKLYGDCFDPWGTVSKAPYGKGETAQQSPELRQAMTDLHLAPALSHYFLTGVQTQFVDQRGKPIQMGNSFIEFNQGVPPGRSSCITCHQYASFNGRQPQRGEAEDNFGRPPRGWPSVGYACNKDQVANCLPRAAGSTNQDFSWILGLMPFGDSTVNPPPAPARVGN